MGKTDTSLNTWLPTGVGTFGKRALRDRFNATLVLALLVPVLLVLALLAGTVGPTAAPARAAGPQEVTGFGSNPGNLRMFRFVPDGLPAGRPLVVALHGCTQSAADYGSATGWARWAQQWRVALLLPEQRPLNNLNSCFNWFQPGDMSRGSGEAESIRQMVDRMKADHGSDAARVYVTGLSAGGAMTAVMASAYPEVFRGAAVVAGIPYGCARTVLEGLQCMSPGVDLSPQQWGDRVRAAYPSHRGPWPTMSVWHGSKDTTVLPVNMTGIIRQWTNVHGTDAVADTSDTVAGHSHQVYRDSSGQPVVESYSIADMAHGQPVDPGSGGTQCGSAGQYFPDKDICASYRIGQSWGLPS